jgi:hypothetical protein
VAVFLDSLKADHASLRGLLDACASSRGAELRTKLLELQSVLRRHLPAKDELYRSIAQASVQKADAASGALAKIFENNMKVQAAGVEGFFSQLEALQKVPEQLERRVLTVIDVLRSRLDTEERAVFPLHKKLIDS